MLAKLLLSRTSLPDLEKSLDAYALREKVISNNIANVNTPGYHAREVSFEDQFQSSVKGMELTGQLTVGEHIPIGAGNIDKVMPRVQPAKGTSNDSGMNNVDIDHEMTELAKNNISYEMSINLTKKKLTNLRAAITGRS